MHIFSKKDLETGKKLLEDHRVLSLVFSGGTYQIEVLASKKPKEVVWPFLQLSDSGDVVDAFCTCKTAANKGSCEHLAASYLKIDGEEPLHIRFKESLWNQIGLISAERHGYEPNCLKRSGESFEAFSQGGKRLFLIRAKKGKTLKKLEGILFERPVETEENSIKFSNLTQEELNLWLEGRPPPRLSYELSFWSDFSKWWMLLQDEGASYKLHFSDEDPPQFLNVQFPDLQIEFFIDKNHWPELIRPLEKVESPLVVHPYLLGNLTGVVFQRDKGIFCIEFEEEKGAPKREELKEEGIRMGDWIYYPKKGFYPRDYDPLLSKKIIKKDQVSAFFERHFKVIQQFLKGEIIHPDSAPVRYELEFDKDYTLSVRGYLFERGDLQQPGAHYFGDWAYLPEKGFFYLENQMFDAWESVYQREKVSDFVNRHRVWLHGFEGFQTHVSGVESHMGYRFDEDQNLIFFTRLEFTEEAEKIVDLGDWIYVEGKGFYEKIAARPGAHVKPGLEVPPYEISNFIHSHRDELEPLPGFFSPICPLEKSGLHIGFNEERKIQIDPEFFFRPGYVAEKVKIFGDYTYVDREGFSLIPHDSRLPESYKVTKVIDRLAEPYFVSYELDLLYPHVLAIDQRLKRPKRMNLRRRFQLNRYVQ